MQWSSGKQDDPAGDFSSGELGKGCISLVQRKIPGDERTKLSAGDQPDHLGQLLAGVTACPHQADLQADTAYFDHDGQAKCPLIISKGDLIRVKFTIKETIKWDMAVLVNTCA